ncbi:immunity protein [Xenorhabdus szentirmaii]|nr:immunity protein [Xenorhabdus szentirmaii DSM 16338]PHM40751.1 immunity protein [Xenorhabdus szentirmaii]
MRPLEKMIINESIEDILLSFSLKSSYIARKYEASITGFISQNLMYFIC